MFKLWYFYSLKFCSWSSFQVVERWVAHFDLLYAWVPLVYFFNSDKQDVIELIHTGVQHCLQPKDFPAPWNHFATDHIAITLKRKKNTGLWSTVYLKQDFFRVRWPLMNFDESALMAFLLIRCYLSNLQLPSFFLLQNRESLPHCFLSMLYVQLIFFCWHRFYIFWLGLCKRQLFVIFWETQSKTFNENNTVIFYHYDLNQFAVSRGSRFVPTAAGVWSPDLSLPWQCVEVLHDWMKNKTA